MTGRGKTRKKLLDDLKKNRGQWKFKDEAWYNTLWKPRLGRSYGPDVGETTERLDTVISRSTRELKL